jgi:hypothetical protein
VKNFKGGKVKTVRVQTASPYGHLINDGFKVVAAGRATTRGAFGGETRVRVYRNRERADATDKKVEGRHMLEDALKEAESRFDRDAQKLLDQLTKEVEL